MAWIATPGSRTFVRVQYVAKGGRLALQFRKGNQPVYVYRGVPSHVFVAFTSARSLGAFYSRRIRDRYPADLIG